MSRNEYEGALIPFFIYSETSLRGDNLKQYFSNTG